MAQVIEFERYAMDDRWHCDCGAVHDGIFLTLFRSDKANERFDKEQLGLLIDILQTEYPS